MTFSLMEGAINALYAYLSANIATELDVVDAQFGDSVVLEDIKTWYLGNIPKAVPNYPSIFFNSLPFTPKRNLEKGKVDVEYNIDIVILVGWPDEQERFRRLDRYAMAIMQLMEKNTLTYSYKWRGEIKKSDEFESNGIWLQAYQMPLQLSRTEKY